MVLERTESEAEICRRGGRTGHSPQDFLDRDSRPVPAVMRKQSIDPTLGSEEVAREKYVTTSFHDEEMAKLWSRVWQMACHSDEIPAVGDSTVYEIGDWSIIVVRVGEEAFKAFHNSCLHRGTRLCNAAGNYREFRCPFHAWTWHIDGRLKNIPSQWDFPQLEGADVSLPEVQVDTWGGFVFVNFDPDAPPLAEHLGGLPTHYDRWPLEDRPAVMWVRKEVDCNWKAGIESFIEGYHVSARTPRRFPTTATAIRPTTPTKASRTSAGSSFPPLSRATTSTTTFRSKRSPTSCSRPASPRPTAGPSRSPTAPWRGPCSPKGCANFWGRPRLSIWTGCRTRRSSTAFSTTSFPTWSRSAGWVRRSPTASARWVMTRNGACSRFMCSGFMQATGRHAPALTPTDLGPDDRFGDIPAFGILGEILDQDVTIMGLNQAGLRASRQPGLKLGCTRSHAYATITGHWIVSSPVRSPRLAVFSEPAPSAS